MKFGISPSGILKNKIKVFRPESFVTPTEFLQLNLCSFYVDFLLWIVFCIVGGMGSKLSWIYFSNQSG